MNHQCHDDRNEQCSPDHCATIGCPSKKWSCVKCDCKPDARDLERIKTDLTNAKIAPVAWYCPRCAPDLEIMPSGLAWDVIEVVGASPR